MKILLLIFLFHSVTLHAGWEESKQIFQNGIATCFVISGDTLFVGNDIDGVFLSTDNGKNWSETGLKGQTVRSLFIFNAHLLAGTDNGVFMSSDNGITWSQQNAENIIVSSFASSGSVLFAGSTKGVFVSTNYGTDWTQTGLTNEQTYGLTVSDSNLFAATDSIVYYSHDKGTHWIQTGLTGHRIHCLTVLDRYLFAGTDSGVFLSTNNGTDWSASNNGLPTNPYGKVIISLVSSDSIIFAVVAGELGFGEIYRSTNYGSNWNFVSSELPWGYLEDLVEITALIVSGKNILVGYSVDIGGPSPMTGWIYRSTDIGESWIPVYSGTERIVFTVLTGYETHLFAGTYYPFGGLFHSSDKGLHWTHTYSVLSNFDITALAVSDSILFAGTEGGGIFFSTDNGQSWEEMNTGLTNKSVLGFAFTDSMFFVLTSGGIFQSTNKSKSWISIDAPVAVNYIRSIAVFPFGVLFIGTDARGVFRSTNNGINWNNVGLETFDIKILVTSGENLFAASNGGWIFLTTDKGDNWVPAYNGIKNTPLNCLAVSESTLVAGTYSNGVFLSTNYGSSWSACEDELTGSYICSIFFNGTDVFATTLESIWRKPKSELLVSVHEKNNIAPFAFSLSQNYPNPFNPSTVISYQLPVNSKVSLKIYDLLGREIATLVNEEQSAGLKEVEWNASNVASGMYLAIMQAGNFVEMKKMMVLK